MQEIGTLVIHFEHDGWLQTFKLPSCLYVPGISSTFLVTQDWEQVTKSNTVWRHYRYHPRMINGETIFEPVAPPEPRPRKRRKKDKIIPPKPAAAAAAAVAET